MTSKIKYKDLDRIIKKFSFHEKMKLLNFESRMVLSQMIENDPEIIRSSILPEELDTLALFAVYYKEYGNDKISRERFGNIISAIRNFQAPALDNLNGTNLLRSMLPAVGENQFSYQKYGFHLIYRFNYFFNYVNDLINMPSLIKDRISVSNPDRLLELCYFILLMSYDRSYIKTYESIDKIIEYYIDVVNSLSKTREEHIELINTLTNSKDDFKSCLKPFGTYPFVNYKNRLYLPLVYMIIPACTSSIMFRLTLNDTHTRRLVGKEVYESYLFKILNESGIFQSVYPEQSFGNGQKSLDVLCKENDAFVLFDSKSMTLKTGAFLYDDQAIESDIMRATEAVCQVYKHTHDLFGKSYNPFKTKDIDIKNVFGCVVIPRIMGIMLDDVFDHAAVKLKIDKHSYEFQWLESHINILDIDEIEKHCFTQTEFVSYSVENEEFCWQNNCKSKYANNVFLDFKNRYEDNFMKVVLPTVFSP